MREELKHRQNECSRLRTLLASRHGAADAGLTEPHNVNPQLMNEDGELEMAYHTQMELNGSAFFPVTFSVSYASRTNRHVLFFSACLGVIPKRLQEKLLGFSVSQFAISDGHWYLSAALHIYTSG